jgi:hypothetical protein
VKIALMVQDAPPATEAQLSVSLNGALVAIVIAMAEVPLLETVKVLAALGDPTPTLPNLLVAGVIDAGATPVPVTAPESGLPPA